MAFSVPFKPSAVVATLSADQDIVANEVFAWDTVQVNIQGSASISLDTTTNVGRFTLEGGWVYEVTATIDCVHTAPCYLWFSIYDVTGAAAIGASLCLTKSSTNTSDDSGNGILVWILSPSSDNAYDIREDGGRSSLANTDIDSDRCKLVIKCLGPA